VQVSPSADAQSAKSAVAEDGLPSLPNRGQRCAFRVIEHGIDTVGFTYKGEGIDDLASLYAQTTHDIDTGEVVERVRRDGRVWLVIPPQGCKRLAS
jgi:6-phosphogluconate dehydrogenase (decarboxylating)